MTRQTDKLRELRGALIRAGYISLDQQAGLLGLPRSTTHAILSGRHKCAGLQARLVARMWACPALPPAARRILTEWIEERSRGYYGHDDAKRARFNRRLASLLGADIESGDDDQNVRQVFDRGA